MTTVNQQFSFAYTGAFQNWVVPADVLKIRIECYGASGAQKQNTAGLGGKAWGEFTVTPGETLYVSVGGVGGVGAGNLSSGQAQPGTGGWNGGGNAGSQNASGGGGATDVRRGDTTLNSRIIVAGGGGGASENGNGGAGGGLTGTAGSRGAGGGSQTAGGAGYMGGGTNTGANGTLGQGGSGFSDGGGGGSGYYGGGGDYGSWGADGGGGGGSSYISSAATNSGTTAGTNSGNGSAVFTVLAVDQSPNAPTGLSPAGTSGSPGTARSLTPVLSWLFSDPDSGNTQSTFQVQVFTSSGTLLHDSGQVSSVATSYTVPTSASLQPNTTYYWTVRTLDNYGIAGAYAGNQFFKTSQAPSVSNLTPGNVNSATPDGSSSAPRLSWTYTDPENDSQSAFQVKVYNASTNLLVYDSGKVNAALSYHDVPSGVLGAGIKFYWNVTVWDSTGMFSTAANEYILTNTPPAPVTLVSPTDTYRVGLRPMFVANTGDDPENDKQNFKIQLADNSSFTVNLKEMSTATATTGWEAYNGTAWVAFPSSGIDSTFEGKQVRYTWQSDLTEGKTYYWRIAPIDGTTGTLGNWSSTRTIRVGDTLQFKLKNPTKTTAAAKKIVLTGVRKVATDGTAPSVLKVEVCNNGLDATPNWEDATAYFLNGQTYVFTNTAKTGTDWAVDCRVTIKANDSLGAIEFDGLGFSFS